MAATTHTITSIALHTAPSGKVTKWGVQVDGYQLADTYRTRAQALASGDAYAAGMDVLTDTVEAADAAYYAEGHAEGTGINPDAMPTPEQIEAAAQAAAAEREAAKANRPTPTPRMDPTEAEAKLTTLDAAWAAAKGDRKLENDALAHAHDAGLTWAAIGTRVGMTGVSARRRWVYATGQPIPASWSAPRGSGTPRKPGRLAQLRDVLAAIAAHPTTDPDVLRAMATEALAGWAAATA